MRLFLILMMLILSPDIFAAKRWGVGITVGSGVGLTVRNLRSNQHAYDYSAITSNGQLLGAADYIYRFRNIYREKRSVSGRIIRTRLDFSLGLGGFVVTREDGGTDSGVRIPIAASLIFYKSGYELFTQFDINQVLTNEAEMGFDFVIGIRYYI